MDKKLWSLQGLSEKGCLWRSTMETDLQEETEEAIAK